MASSSASFQSADHIWLIFASNLLSIGGLESCESNFGPKWPLAIKKSAISFWPETMKWFYSERYSEEKSYFLIQCDSIGWQTFYKGQSKGRVSIFIFHINACTVFQQNWYHSFGVYKNRKISEFWRQRHNFWVYGISCMRTRFDCSVEGILSWSIL